MVEYFKLPWENPDGYRQHSPLTHAAKVTTPLLIQHGDRDPRVPLATAQKFFRALSVLGKTVEMDIYPRGGHCLLRAAARTYRDAAKLRLVPAMDKTAELVAPHLRPESAPTPLSFSARRVISPTRRFFPHCRRWPAAGGSTCPSWVSAGLAGIPSSWSNGPSQRHRERRHR
jgi:hypothetical protein